MSDKSDTTTDYHIYEHRDGEDCNDDIFGGRAVPAARSDFDENTEPTCSAIRCENNLVHQRTESVDGSLPEIPEFRQDTIDGLSDHERALMLGMAMESIRGNWNDMKERLGIIGYICDAGVGNHLSDDFIKNTENTARSLWKQRRVDHLHPDGRSFRGSSDGRYGKLWEEVEKDPELMRPLASHLPNDMTWSTLKFDKMGEQDQ